MVQYAPQYSICMHVIQLNKRTAHVTCHETNGFRWHVEGMSGQHTVSGSLWCNPWMMASA